MTQRDDLLAERAESIRDLCRGIGLTPAHVDELLPPEDIQRIFNVGSATELVDLIAFAIDKVPASHQTMALRAALAANNDTGSNLSKRREAYITYLNNQIPGEAPTLRTLIRWEADGAEKLAVFLDAAQALVPAETTKEASLSSRIADLEAVLVLLINEYIIDQHGVGGTRAASSEFISLLERVSTRGLVAARESSSHSARSLIGMYGPDPDKELIQTISLAKMMQEGLRRQIWEMPI